MADIAGRGDDAGTELVLPDRVAEHPGRGASAILDDMDSRPGSTTSLLRTVVGLYLRRVGCWMSIADIIQLMEQLGVPAPRTRTAVVRLKKKELLLAKTVGKTIGYELNPDATIMLAKGDRRIFSARNMRSDDAWCLISFSLPEEQRHLRHQLRRRLYWIGGGMVSPALWICPDFLALEVEDILDDLDIRQYTTLFRTERPRVAGELREAIGEWWDLGALETLHREFISELTGFVNSDEVTPAEAFARYIRGVDTWRMIPYLDPGLPYDLLPADWPGAESTRLFEDLSARYSELSWQFVTSLGETSAPRGENRHA
ncbi:PaaX family transcriptional regulator [Subtercola frigoramans]|uniref:Phenylacetic acid degradation operon negative regulatory protein n=1 Tax=Subtercola frigoramans TaxID=120298 RepID=A0ABS2L7F3_9MICO|nr:PaaX family transcriptional regulator C-terminal domain-containing protein [Subtercola frigoramans]MBM7473028.1 phenylacetic acid degradation operon negative regulatory protein [Subtercola frigoramans]